MSSFRLGRFKPINGSYQQKMAPKIEGSEDVELNNVVGIIPGVNKELEPTCDHRRSL